VSQVLEHDVEVGAASGDRTCWNVRVHGTITISSSFAAGGTNIGLDVATQLGLQFFDRAIPVAVARKLNVDQKDAIAQDWKAPGRLERVLAALSSVSLPIGLPEMQGEIAASPSRFKDATEEVLRQIADGEGGVVLGRASMVVLHGRPDVLSVRLSGPADARIAQMIALTGTDEATARAEQKATDDARAAYAQAFYGVRQDDPDYYHLVLDTTVISHETCAQIIIAAAKDRFGG
jgi:cytidylate kinase